jgi:hypothetical protein
MQTYFFNASVAAMRGRDFLGKLIVAQGQVFVYFFYLWEG